MKRFEILKQRPLRVLVFISAGLFFIGLMLILWNVGRMPQNIILQFDVFHGITRLGNILSLFVFWFGSLLIGFINCVLAEELYYRNRSLTYIFTITTLILSFLALIAVGTMVSVN